MLPLRSADYKHGMETRSLKQPNDSCFRMTSQKEFRSIFTIIFIGFINISPACGHPFFIKCERFVRCAFNYFNIQCRALFAFEYISNRNVICLSPTYTHKTLFFEDIVNAIITLSIVYAIQA